MTSLQMKKLVEVAGIEPASRTSGTAEP